MFHLSVRHNAVAVPYTPAVVNLFPHGKKVTVQGKELVALPHGIDETRMLRNLGIQVPAPVLSQYDWAAKEGGVHEPFEIQRKTVAMLTLNTRAYVLNGMGTGKTRAALWAWDFLNKSGLAGKLLVVAPLSTLNFTWMWEIFQTLPHRKAGVLHGPRAKRISLLDDTDSDIYICNHDGMGIILNLLKTRQDIDTLVLDECSTYRNGASKRTKVIREYAKQMKWVWGMSGAPTPNEPTDAWAQASIITPHTVPKYFTRFRDEVMYKKNQFKYIPKPDAVEKVYAALQPAVRFSLADVTELPDLVVRTIDIEMGINQKKVYTHMKNNAYAAVQAKEITAMNAGSVLMKLLQISTGWVYTSKRDVVALDNDNRLNALVTALESTERKVIVFVPFIHAMEGVAARLRKEGIDVETISGATPNSARAEIFSKFQNTSSIKVLVAHPGCMAHGITLTAADTIVWFAPIPSLEIFDQANARITRVGQKHRQLILLFQSTEVEKKTYARLRAKQKTQNLLLDMVAEETANG